jgi:reactive intermediate/imine deaminase
MPAQYVNPTTMHTPRGYTHVVTVTSEKLIFISGQIAIDPSGNIVGKDDFRAQAEQVYANIGAALEAAGADFSHLVKLTVFLVDMANLPVLREVRDKYVNTNQPPASSAFQVTALFMPEFMVEIEAVAMVP